MKTRLLAIVVLLIAICLIAGFFLLSGEKTKKTPEELKLSDFPEVFKEDTVIVIGDNASEIEKESAEEIAASLENLTGNKPRIISSEKIESHKYTNNLIILGTPNSNEVLRKVYTMTNATRVTEEYPGENKGVLEILRNPWNEGKAMLLVEGWDEWGVKGGSEALERSIEMDKNSVISKWAEPTIEIIKVNEMSFLQEHITPPKNQTVTFVGKYNDRGYPNGSCVDVFILKENNTVKWNHFFLNTKLNVSEGKFVNVTGFVAQNDLYGYAPLINVQKWNKEAVEINQHIFDCCKNGVIDNAETISQISLINIAEWDKESLQNFKLNKNDFQAPDVTLAFVDFENKKIVGVFKCQKIPPFNDLLNRWIYIYCVYSVEDQEVEKLIVTIQGEVLDL